MNLEQLLQAAVHRSDLAEVDAQFTAIGVSTGEGFVRLKGAILTLANVADFEPTIRPTYKELPEPSVIIKPLQSNLAFCKYLRNKFVGHIHPTLLSKAIEWQPILTQAPCYLENQNFLVALNLWLLETAINTYVDGEGNHKIFDGETDLMYPPDWRRFVDFLGDTIRGTFEYLSLLNSLWAPKLTLQVPAEFNLELAIRSGQTEFRFLAQ